MNSYYLHTDIVTICEHFADRVISTNSDCYAKRNQKDLDKIRQDIMLGKIAEWGVYFIYLNRNRTNINPPDMSIYPKDKKSFDPDLRWGLYNLHIKSQTLLSAERYGESWIFQAKDPLFEYCSEYDIIVGCRLSEGSTGYYVEIRLEKPFEYLKFAETKLSKFAGNKKALYLKDNNE